MYQLHDVFLSYRRREADGTEQGTKIAEAVYHYLRAKDLRVFWDRPETETGPFDEQLRWQLEHAPNYIFIATEAAMNFRHVKDGELDYVAEEVKYALNAYILRRPYPLLVHCAACMALVAVTAYTCAAPASSRHLAHSWMVAPVVSTSSTTNTDAWKGCGAENAPRICCARSSRCSPRWVALSVAVRTSSGSAFNPQCVASPSASTRA